MFSIYLQNLAEFHRTWTTFSGTCRAESVQASAQAWRRCSGILESATLPESKFLALQVLEDTIKYRWKVLPSDDEREGMKQYIVEKVIASSSSAGAGAQGALDASSKAYLAKLNLLLVRVLVNEWPHNWPSFISDIVNASKTNETLCENNMIILKLLSEEVRVLTHRRRHLKPRP